MQNFHQASTQNTGVQIRPYPNQEGNKLHSPNFVELVSSLPHPQQFTTSKYPSQIKPFLCPSHFWLAQLVSFLIGLRTYQHPVVFVCVCYIYTYRKSNLITSSGSQISRQSTYEGGKFVSHTHRPPLHQEMVPVLISVRGWVYRRAIVRPEGLCQWKFAMTPSGFESEPIRLVALCLNQLRHPVSNQYI